MNNINKITILLLSTFIFLGCTEEVKLDLKDNSDKLVIEGEVNDGPGPYYVKVSKSNDFYNSSNFRPYDPTYIAISDNDGNIDTLVKVESGIYKTSTLVGKVGNTYNLEVNDNGKKYTSSSRLNSLPNIDSIYTYEYPAFEILSVSVKIKDPIDETNFYRYFAYINGNSPQRFDVFEDRLINGTDWRLSVFDAKKGDSVEFVLLGIDKANFDYWEVLIQNKQAEPGDNPPAAPTDPASNIVGPNKVLGYFSAHSRKTASIYIK